MSTYIDNYEDSQDEDVPHIPVIRKFTISHPDYNFSEEVDTAIVDTGADCSILPTHLVEELLDQGVRTKTALVQGLGKRRFRVTIVETHCHISELTTIESVKWFVRDGWEPIIGRDILNTFKTVLTGKLRQIEIQD